MNQQMSQYQQKLYKSLYEARAKAAALVQAEAQSQAQSQTESIDQHRDQIQAQALALKAQRQFQRQLKEDQERSQINDMVDLEQKVCDLQEQLDQNQKKLEVTKAQLKIADSQLLVIRDLRMQLDQEKKDHEKTKSQLEIAEIKLSDRTSEVEGLRNTIQSLVVRDKASYEKIHKNGNFEQKTESKFQMLKMEMEKVNKKFDEYKLENDKKFEDLKEHISQKPKLNYQEEIKKLEEIIKQLKSENALLQDDLSNKITETKWLEEYIQESQETDAKKDEKIQKLEEKNKQKDSRLFGLENELSDVVDEYEKRNLEYHELKRKYDEVVGKLNGMDELQKAMKDLELKHSQLLLQQQQQQQQQLQLQKQLVQHQLQQQLDKTAKENQSPTYSDSLRSKKLNECASYLKKHLDAMWNKDSEQYVLWLDQYRRCFNSLSREDQEKCIEIGEKYKDLKKKEINSQ